MMFTLVAVALAGLVMVETAPDFSNYAVLAKGEEFDRNLESIRRVVAMHPFCLTTADAINPGNPTTGVLTADDLLACLQQFTVSQVGPPELISSSREVIATVPRDPYVPTRDWLSSTPQSKFWAAAYNCIRNPSFYAGAREEALLDNSIALFFQRLHGGTSHRIHRCDRFGLRIQQICYQGATAKMYSAQLSPDGSAIAFASDFFDDPVLPDHNDIFVVGVTSFLPRPVTDHRRLETPVKASYDSPVWSADGSRLAFVSTEDGTLHKHLYLSPPFKDDPSMALSIGARPITTGALAPVLTNIGGVAWAPLSSDEAFIGRSRYVAFTFTSGGNTALSLYDLKTKLFVFDRIAGAASSSFAGYLTYPCDAGVVPVWQGDEDSLLYGRNGAGDIYKLAEPGRYPAAMTVTFDTGITDVDQMLVVPGYSSLNYQANWLVYRSRTDHRLYRVRVNPPQPGSKVFFPVTTIAVEPGFDVSRRGTMVAFVDELTQTKLYTANVDGTVQRLVLTAPEPIQRVMFSEVAVPWVGPATRRDEPSYQNAKIVSPERADTRVELKESTNAWRSFMAAGSDFPGDFKFASSWLRLQPPENQGQFLFDDGWLIWRAPVDAPKSRPDSGTFVFMGKIDPTWSWQGSTYIAKEAVDPTGGEPADLFKQAFRAATTLIAGRGYTPDIAPSDSEFCYAAAASPLSTYPGDSTTYPIEDLDLWISNTSGAAEPAPRCLTADTPDSHESQPSYSPDGRYVYFTRERQFYSPFLASHDASICRVTPFGGVYTVIQECGSTAAEWSGGHWGSQIEYYSPCVSPDGTRVAFIGKERLTSAVDLTVSPPPADNYDLGDVITECIYVKDVLFNTEPILLLRCLNGEPDFVGAAGNADPWGSYQPVNGTILKDCSVTNLSWSPNGEELFATICTPMNKKYPKCLPERASTNPDHSLGGLPYGHRYYDFCHEQIVLAVPVSISHFQDGVNSREFASGNLDPPGFKYTEDNYRTVLQNQTVGTAPGGPLDSHYRPNLVPVKYAITNGDADKVPDWHSNASSKNIIFNTVHSRGPFCFQRVLTDSPFWDSDGFSLGLWYVLSGYVRTSMESEADQLRAGQMMVQIFNNKGTLVALSPPGSGKIYQVGYPDIGGTQWTRFSAGIQLDLASFIHDRDMPPYYINLMLYTTGRPGSWVEFTGLKLEKAFDINSLRPTRFSPGWILFSPSLDPDPRHPGYLLFER